jgi:hypothetical protein
LIGNPIWSSLSGSQDSYWLAIHLYAADVLVVPYPESALVRLRLHDEVARSCGWWWPYKETCICTDRPETLEWNGASPPQFWRVRYRDGFEVKP